MYKLILVPLDNSTCDRAILEHIKTLAKLCGSHVALLHVATGWAAQTFGEDAVSPEINEDTEYLRNVRTELEDAGIQTTAELAYGEPKKEILKWVEVHGPDLIAMSTHGHKFLGDLFLAPPLPTSSTAYPSPYS